MDGRAGRLTLALPLCPVPPARPSRQTPPQCSQGKELKGDIRHVLLRTLPAADGTLTRIWELGGVLVRLLVYCALSGVH